MRRILFFAVTITLFASCSKSNSGGNPTPPDQVDTLYNWEKGDWAGVELDDVWFFDNKNGLILTSSSIFSSADSGTSFSQVPNTTTFSVFSVHFLDNLQGYVQGRKQLGFSKDAGKTWLLKTLPTEYGITSKFLFPATGYYCDYNKGIYKSTDSGTSWKLIFDGTGKGPNFVFDFVDSTRGFVMVNGNFNKTVDGGASWQLVADSVTGTDFRGYYKMQFLDTLNGYCATRYGLFKTSDGGKTWQNKLPRQTTYMIPYFFDKDNGYLLAANNLYKTIDGGNNWTVSCKLGQDDFSGMHFLDMNTGWATTFGGYVLRLNP